MSDEINYQAQELSVEELDTVAGGTGGGIDQLLVKKFDASFDQGSISDARANSVGAHGAQSYEATQLDQVSTDGSNLLVAKLGS